MKAHANLVRKRKPSCATEKRRRSRWNEVAPERHATASAESLFHEATTLVQKHAISETAETESFCQRRSSSAPAGRQG